MAARPVPTPVPTPTPPKSVVKSSTPAPVVRLAPSGPASTSNFIPVSNNNVVKQNGAWYWNPSTGQSEQYWEGGNPTSNPGSGSTTFDIPAPPDVSGIYNPIYENYDRDQAFATETYGAQQGLLGEQLTSAQGILARDKTEREGYNKTQEEDLNKQLQSAYSEAVRTYNAFQQQARAKFGRGNSAGQAIGELAQGEYFRAQGNVQETHLKNIGAIQSDFRKYLLWSSDEEQRLMQEHKAQNLQLTTAYNQQLNQISNNRNITRSEQARAVLQAQELYNSRKADLNNQVKLQQMALTQYGEKLKMDLAAQIQLANATKYSVAPGTFNNDVDTDLGFNTQTKGTSTQGGSEVNPFQLAAKNRNFVEDEFDSNPYFTTA